MMTNNKIPTNSEFAETADVAVAARRLADAANASVLLLARVLGTRWWNDRVTEPGLGRCPTQSEVLSAAYELAAVSKKPRQRFIIAKVENLRPVLSRRERRLAAHYLRLGLAAAAAWVK